MSEAKGPTRRVVLGALALPLFPTFGCSKPEFSCASSEGLSPDEQKARAAMNYVDRSPNLEQPCEACQQWLPPEEAGRAPCGGCKVIAGPIHPRGTCRLFSERG